MKFLPKSNQKRRQSGVPASSVQNVFSYHASRSNDSANTGRAGQMVPAAGRSWWRWLPSIAAALAVLACLGYVLKLDANPKMSLANQTNLALHDPKVYQQAARLILKKSWLDHNKLTVDTGKVERSLKNQFPELDEVSLTLPLIGHRPVIEVATVQPALLLSAPSGLFVIAGNGRAVASGVNMTNQALSSLPKVIDKSNLSYRLGAAVLPEAQVDFITHLLAQLKAQSLAIDSLSLPITPNEVDVTLKNSRYYLKFNTMLEVRQQVGGFLAVKQRLASQHILPQKYVDLRVEEKVFYK